MTASTAAGPGLASPVTVYALDFWEHSVGVVQWGGRFFAVALPLVVPVVLHAIRSGFASGRAHAPHEQTHKHVFGAVRRR